MLNGGIKTMQDAASHLDTFDGVMLGRAAYQTPACLLAADRLIETGQGDDMFDMQGALAALARYRPYMQARLEEGTKLSSMTRHMLGLFAGQPGARAWRRTLSEKAVRDGADLDVLDEALSHVAGAEVAA